MENGKNKCKIEYILFFIIFIFYSRSPMTEQHNNQYDTNSNGDDLNNDYGVLGMLNALLSTLGYYGETTSEHPIINDNDYTNNPMAIDNDKDKNDENQAIFIDNEPDNCPICLDEMDKEPTVSLQCRVGIHKFHESCMACTLSALHGDRLFPNSATFYNFKCPMCRDIHQYQSKGKGYSKVPTLTFQEYWFWKSIWIYSVYENLLMTFPTVYLLYYLTSMYRYKRTINTTDVQVSHHVAFGVLCLIIGFKFLDLVDMASTKRIYKRRHKNISTLNFPLIPYIMLALASITHYYLYTELRDKVDMTDIKIIMYSAGPIYILFMLLNKMIVECLIYRKPSRRDYLLKRCQLIANLHCYYRRKKKKMFAMNFTVKNDRQTITIKATQ